MKVISLAKTKELLGITDTSLDTQIERYIPIIDAKVKEICGNRFNFQIIGNVTSGSKIVEIYGLTNSTGGINNNYVIDDLKEFAEVGMMIEGDSIDTDVYIDEIYYNGYSKEISSINKHVPTILLSKDATATDTDAELFIGINMAYQTTIAKGIAWLIGQENQTSPDLGWTSQHIGSVSVVRGIAQAAIDGRYGMPVWFVNALPKYMSVQ